MTEKPRTWTLEQGQPGEDIVASGGPEIFAEDVPVIELEPVLDLLERLQPWLPQVQTVQPGNQVFKTREETEALLREHGRLQ